MTPRKRKAEGAKPAAPWRGREVAVLEGGPLDPRWLFVDDLARLERVERASTRGWPYRRTTRHVTHPNYDATGVVYERLTGPQAAAAGRAARDEGIAATTEAHEDAARSALRIIADAADRFDELSANTVREAMDAAQVPGPVRGAAFRAAVAAGLLEPVGFTASTHEATHAHRVYTYRSLTREDRIA